MANNSFYPRADGHGLPFTFELDRALGTKNQKVKRFTPYSKWTLNTNMSFR